MSVLSKSSSTWVGGNARPCHLDTRLLLWGHYHLYPCSGSCCCLDLPWLVGASEKHDLDHDGESVLPVCWSRHRHSLAIDSDTFIVSLMESLIFIQVAWETLGWLMIVNVLPNKEYFYCQKWQRINMVVKCIVYLHITTELKAHGLLVSFEQKIIYWLFISWLHMDINHTQL